MEFLDRTFYLDNNQNYESKIKNDIWCIMLILSGTYTITNYESKRRELFGRVFGKLGEKVSRATLKTFSLNPLIHPKDFVPRFFRWGIFQKQSIDAGQLSIPLSDEAPAPRFDDLFKYLCPLARFLFFRDRLKEA